MSVAVPAQKPMSLLRQLLWPTLFTLFAGGILVALGIWQLHRLAWKEGLLNEIAQRADAPPVAVPQQAAWAALKPDDYDYRHVVLAGRFAYQDTALVFTPSGPQGAGPGYLFLTPLKLASGAYVIVNRGFVPADLAPKLRAESGADEEVHLTGLMRPSQARGPFTPPDHPEKGEYFTRDPALIAAAFHLTPAAPFSVDVDAVPGATAWPRSGTTDRDLPNNHLGYALTWFGLAVGLLGVFVSFVIRKIVESRQSGIAQS